jgi:hypothetical protein
VDGARFIRTEIRLRIRIRACAALEAARPRGAAPPIAVRSELGGELRRVVYGGVKAVRNVSCNVGGGTVHFWDEENDWAHGDKNAQVGQSTEEGVAVITDLQRLEAACGTARALNGQGRSFTRDARKEFQRQEEQQKSRNRSSTIHTPLLVMMPRSFVKNCQIFHESGLFGMGR